MLPQVFLIFLSLPAYRGLVAAFPTSNGNISDTGTTRQESHNTTHRKWINQVLLEVLPSFTLHSKSNKECNRQAELYRRHLANLTLWAVEMHEASAYTENGVLVGNEYNMGLFDECIRINVPDQKIVGKYCHTRIKFSSNYYDIEKKQSFKEYTAISPYDPVWKKIQKVSDDRIKYRDWFALGLCIPAGCEHTDLQDSLNEILLPALNKSGITGEVTVKDEYCTVYNEGISFSPGGYVYLLVLSSLFLTVTVATLVHLVYQSSYDSSKEGNSIVLFFSAISNTRRLVRQDERHEFSHISGIKVITMLMIILGHRILISYYWPFSNVEDQEKIFDFIPTMIFVNGPIVVNTFLFITGFLVFNKILHDINKGRTINVPVYIIYRWLRIAPVYLLVLCGVIFLKSPFSNEYFYKSEALSRIETCTNNWWTYILFINNYYGADKECLVPAWYLAVDMQLYVVLVIIGFIMSKSKKIGYIVLGIFLALSHIIPAIVVYVKGFVPVVSFYLNYIDNYYRQDDFVYSYVPTHTRAGPYFIGALFAIILGKLKERGYKFSPLLLQIGTVYCLFGTFGSLLFAYEFYQPDTPLNLWVSAIYVSVHRILWATGMGLIVLVGAIHPNFKMLTILRVKLFGVLNKLLLTTLLAHTLIQAQTSLLQRNPEYLNLFLFAWKTAGDVTMSYFFSYVVYLILEAPLARIQDFGLKKILGEPKKS